jgi:hypothetical protein
MMTTMTRQDLLTITEGAKNKIIERLVTKYDVQAACDNARDRILNSLNAFYLENQAIIRQSNAQRDQAWRRIASLESQIGALQQDIRNLTQAVNRLNDQRVRI